jgi:hypothetical protein
MKLWLPQTIADFDASLEFDLRVYLNHLAAGGEGLWPATV